MPTRNPSKFQIQPETEAEPGPAGARKKLDGAYGQSAGGSRHGKSPPACVGGPAFSYSLTKGASKMKKDEARANLVFASEEAGEHKVRPYSTKWHYQSRSA
jgi:hypothetical protein